MRFDILTLFPDFFITPLNTSIIGRAISSGALWVSTHNIRDYSTDKHHTTDDSPYGGGHGMVMKPDPVVAAIEAVSAVSGRPKVILVTPQGVPFTQSVAKALSIEAAESGLMIVCGRYEGIDERIREFVDMEISIGDYVLTGGEIAALAIIDSVARFIPGVLGEPESVDSESFSDGLLEYPQYTRPLQFRGIKVPDVLLSGNHAEIERWRRAEALRRTYLRRPDLLEKLALGPFDLAVIEKIKGERQDK